MKIIYIGRGSAGTTSLHRAHALERLGHSVEILDPYAAFYNWLKPPLFHSFHFHTGYRTLEYMVSEWLSQQLKTLAPPDVIWVDSGELLGTKSLAVLKQIQCPIILYNHDDPTGPRDGRRFGMLKQAIPHYTLCLVVRRENVPEFYELGAKQVMRVWRSYDEIEHRPITEGPRRVYKSEVSFVGTWMREENRDELLLSLINSGIRVAIRGTRWEKSPYWSKLRPYVQLGQLTGRDYVDAIASAKISLGLLSKGNRDLHTTRTMEIPYAGGMLCAERTDEHRFLFEENQDAVFFGNASECVERCSFLLADDGYREAIRASGMAKVRALNVGHQDICYEALAKFC